MQGLIDDLLRAADEDRAMRACASLIISPRDRLRSPIRGCVSEKIASIVRIKRVQGILRIFPYVHVGGYADLERASGVPGLRARAPVEIGERRELRRRHHDVGER